MTEKNNLEYNTWGRYKYLRFWGWILIFAMIWNIISTIRLINAPVLQLSEMNKETVEVLDFRFDKKNLNYWMTVSSHNKIEEYLVQGVVQSEAEPLLSHPNN